MSVLSAQNQLGKSDDIARIALNAYVSPQVEGLPSGAVNILKNKMDQLTTRYGFAGSSFNSRFIITPNITVLEKHITPTAPSMTAYTLGISFYVGDGIEGIKFSSAYFEVKGVGTNETKAYIDAIRQINPSNVELKAMLEEGKKGIIEYYNSRCDFILKEAQMLESVGKYDEAIYTLVSVPEVCKQCYEKAMDAVGPVYQKYIDRKCKKSLADAFNAWNAGQNRAAADDASYYLSQIDPNASCFQEGKDLSNTIAKRVKELDAREWSFEMKQHQDGVDLRREEIRAARDVGVAYGNNQPKNVTYNVRYWW